MVSEKAYQSLIQFSITVKPLKKPPFVLRAGGFMGPE